MKIFLSLKDRSAGRCWHWVRMYVRPPNYDYSGSHDDGCYLRRTWLDALVLLFPPNALTAILYYWEGLFASIRAMKTSLLSGEVASDEHLLALLTTKLNMSARRTTMIPWVIETPKSGSCPPILTSHAACMTLRKGGHMYVYLDSTFYTGNTTDAESCDKRNASVACHPVTCSSTAISTTNLSYSCCCFLYTNRKDGDDSGKVRTIDGARTRVAKSPYGRGSNSTASDAKDGLSKASACSKGDSSESGTILGRCGLASR